MSLLDRDIGGRGIEDTPSGGSSSGSSGDGSTPSDRYVAPVRETITSRDIDNREVIVDRYVAPVRQSLAARTFGNFPTSSDNNTTQQPSYSDAIFNMFGDNGGGSIAGGRQYDYPIAVYPSTASSGSSGILIFVILAVIGIGGYVWYRKNHS